MPLNILKQANNAELQELKQNIKKTKKNNNRPELTGHKTK